jgi:hypothetical protein
MVGIWDSFQQFRRSRLAGTLASVIFLLVGLHNTVIETGIGNLVLGLLFLVIGLLGLYNQFLGEPVTETVKKRF